MPNLFSGENKKNIIGVSSSNFAQGVVKLSILEKCLTHIVN